MANHSEKFIERVLRTCREYRMFPTGCRRVVTAVSGGADSVCMLHALNALKNELGITIVVAHLDHAMRGEASRADADFVEDLAASLGLDFRLGRIGENVPPPRGDGSPEALLRNARHAFLQYTAAKSGAGRIALAHNRDDQVETVLMRIVRGTSLLGASGMSPVNGAIVRPLFFVPRADIDVYCKENNIEFRTDETNADQRYTRNRVRHSLLPMLEESFNPEVRRAVFNLSMLLAEDAELLEIMGVRTYEELLVKQADGLIELDMEKLSTLPAPLMKRAIRAAALELLGPDGGLLEAGHIDSICDIALSEKTGMSAEIPKLVVTAKYKVLEFSKAGGETQAAPGAEFEITVPPDAGEIEIPELGVMLTFAEVAFSGVMMKNDDTAVAFLDTGKLADAPLSVRTWREGDTFHPLGAPGKKKLSDFFVDEKIDRADRPRVPLLVCGGEIAWVAGHRISHNFRLDPEISPGVLRITLQTGI